MEIQAIQNKIFELRGARVMLDRDIAEMYQVTTSYLNRVVKRNITRFPEDFMFQLTKEESLRFQIGILKNGSGEPGSTKRPLGRRQKRHRQHIRCYRRTNRQTPTTTSQTNGV